MAQRGFIIGMTCPGVMSAYYLAFGVLRLHMAEAIPPPFPYFIDFERTPPRPRMCYLKAPLMPANENEWLRIRHPADGPSWESGGSDYKMNIPE